MTKRKNERRNEKSAKFCSLKVLTVLFALYLIKINMFSSCSYKFSPFPVVDPQQSQQQHVSLVKPEAVYVPCRNFKTFSLFFDLPLKSAAQKFGLASTAFKKYCRANGIRHWPYRKMRSLKRSINELERCVESNKITEKQRYQLKQKYRQIESLMSPLTYGLTENGELIHTNNNTRLLKKDVTYGNVLGSGQSNDYTSASGQKYYSHDDLRGSISHASELSQNFGWHSNNTYNLNIEDCGNQFGGSNISTSFGSSETGGNGDNLNGAFLSPKTENDYHLSLYEIINHLTPEDDISDKNMKDSDFAFKGIPGKSCSNFVTSSSLSLLDEEIDINSESLTLSDNIVSKFVFNDNLEDIFKHVNMDLLLSADF